jgi:hypothetical protein
MRLSCAILVPLTLAIHSCVCTPIVIRRMNGYMLQCCLHRAERILDELDVFIMIVTGRAGYTRLNTTDYCAPMAVCDGWHRRHSGVAGGTHTLVVPQILQPQMYHMCQVRVQMLSPPRLTNTREIHPPLRWPLFCPTPVNLAAQSSIV